MSAMKEKRQNQQSRNCQMTAINSNKQNKTWYLGFFSSEERHVGLWQKAC